MKKIIVFFSLILFWLVFRPAPVLAQAPVELKLFYSEFCPHCQKEELFLSKLVDKYPNLKITKYQIDTDKNNQKLFAITAARFGITQLGVPLTVISDQVIQGYGDDSTTGVAIEQAIKNQLSKATSEKEKPELPSQISVPILGTLTISQLSLPIFTIIIAALDGFNPCAMWTLLFLISLLLGMKDRRRMWILGTAFIVTSAFVYFLFLSAWLNFFLFVGYSTWVRYLIGLVALGAGGYYLYDYVKNKDGGCRVTGNEKRQQVFNRIKEIAYRQQFWLALFGMILLAFAVNMVELVCSAGLPAVYTQVLSYAKLPSWQHYLYLVFYILVFMLDDLFVFFTAMLTLKAVGLESKYSRYSHLIGGILILL
ncbi:hypothetical protein A2262_02765, partial [Candidatus Roizmanbacteria bacterium RIFOXYA2_FULL_41_8]